MHSRFARRDIAFIFLPWQGRDGCFTCKPNQSVSNAILPRRRAGAHRVICSRSVLIQTIVQNSVMGRTNPYVSKEQEFAFFRFSFEAGTCSSLHQNFSGPCTKYLSRVSPFQLDPANTTNVMFPFVFNFLLFKTCVQSSIGTPNNCSFICQQSTTTLKEYVAISHVSISVPPASDCPTPPHSPMAPEHQETHPAFHF